MEDLKVGSVVEGIVTGIENYGIFVKINEEFCGLIHISEIANGFVKNIEEYANVGEKIFVEIINIDQDKKKCILSIRDLNYRNDKTQKVHESVRGFSPLRHHLKLWIDKKITEIKDESKL